MRWKGARQSDNFEDRRGTSTGGKLALGGIGGIVILLIGLFLGGDPGELMNQLQLGGVGETEYVPTAEEAFTHGTSEQRAYWFKKGYDTGDPAQGDTFSDPNLQ